MFKKNFKFIPQHDQMDCGPACLAMIAKYYGKDYSLNFLRNNSFITREGVSLRGISDASEKIGFSSFSVKLPLKELVDKFISPAILYWNKNHFVVLYRVTKNFLARLIRFMLQIRGME